MKVLVIGSGGREHAIAWKLSRSPSISKIYAAPGNPGIATIAECLERTDYLALAKELAIDLAVVGPEAPLVAGVVDQFRAAGIPIVGPTAECAQLEGSKLYSKRFMERIGIPTARFVTATNRQQAQDAFHLFNYPLVLKTDGLAAGKGVIIAQNLAESREAAAQLNYPLVIEEFLVGEEVSFIVLSDGKTAVPFEPSQDHKTAFDGDTGPNTGGMGAYSDSLILTMAQREEVMRLIIEPVLAETGFTGFLYAGLMMTGTGPKVLEFNVRMGDPETQPLMMRMTSDFGLALFAAATGTLQPEHFKWDPRPSTCVVLASGGYPGAFPTGFAITGIDDFENAIVFHAGTKRTQFSELVTSGGRVLGVTALGNNLKSSMDVVYTAIQKIHFSGMQYRKDIGAKGLRRYNVEEQGT